MSGPVFEREGYESISHDEFEDHIPNVRLVIVGEVNLTEQQGTVMATIDAFTERVRNMFDNEGIDWWIDEVLVNHNKEVD